MRFLKQFLLFAIIAASMTACRSKNTAEAAANGVLTGDNPSIVDSENKENFVEFYDKFMTDSAFQMTRIVFPLEGKPAFIEDSTTYHEDYYYSADLWKPHHKVDFKRLTRWKQEWYDYGFLVKEIADNMPDNMFIERRWRCDDGKWYLIYYSDLNKRNRSDK